MCIRDSAVTHYQVLKRFRGYSLLAFQLETGRTHQIRVHLASIGHPIIGDPLYGLKKDRFSNLDGQCPVSYTHLDVYKRQVLGEAFQTYIVAEGDKGLLLIDKHAAHERMIFNLSLIHIICV